MLCYHQPLWAADKPAKTPTLFPFPLKHGCKHRSKKKSHLSPSRPISGTLQPVFILCSLSSGSRVTARSGPDSQTTGQTLISPTENLLSWMLLNCRHKLVCLNRWSVVGLQGSLLSHLVEPVYLHSLTVGTLGHTGHLGRAMTRRLVPVKHLPFPYRRQQLLLGCRS